MPPARCPLEYPGHSVWDFCWDGLTRAGKYKMQNEKYKMQNQNGVMLRKIRR